MSCPAGASNINGPQLPEDGNNRAALLEPDIVPTSALRSSPSAVRELTPDGLSHEGKLALVELQNGDDAASYAPARSCYAITRYNWSSYYAMAVIELGEAVARERGRQ